MTKNRHYYTKHLNDKINMTLTGRYQKYAHKKHKEQNRFYWNKYIIYTIMAIIIIPTAIAIPHLWIYYKYLW